MADPGTGGAVSGAISGASTGSAFGPWGTAIGAVVGGVGGYLSASGTASAQAAPNKAAALAAASQSAQAWQNYLTSRGINIQQLVAQYPDLQQEYQAALRRGDKRDFNTWLYQALAAAPNHPIWDAIANPAGTAGAANTTLPSWAVDANGKPLQPSLLNQLVGISSGANNPATAPVASIATLENAHALLQAHPEIAAELEAAGVGSDGRSPEQWLVDHITQTESQSGGGTFTTALRSFLTTPATAGGGNTTPPAGPAGTGNNTTIDPAITALLPNAASTLSGLFDGTQLNQVLAGLQPVQAARSAGAAAQLARVNELRGLSGNVLDTELGGIKGVLEARTAGAGGIYDASAKGANDVYSTNVAKLADLLGVRREAAQQIYDASLGAAGGVRDARTGGAKNIYDAELTRADTFNQAAKQALSRVLAEQTAERARRGFTGGSSGSDITRARLNADYFQRGAGARADAGVNYQSRLSDAGIGYATDTGRAGIGRATTLGQASEQDSIAKLNAAVDLARQLGLAGVTKATSLAGAGEQNAIAELQARVADATRRLGYLTSDADLAKANADLANAQDALNALVANQGKVNGAINAPFSLAANDLALKGQLTNQQYGDIDALMRRLQSFTINQTGGPQLTTPPPAGAVLNNSQIGGGALSGLGSIIGNMSGNSSLMDLIKAFSASNGGGSSGTSGTSSTGSLTSSPNFLANASVFAGPG